MIEWGWEFAEHEKMAIVKEKMLAFLLQGYSPYDAVERMLDEDFTDEWILYCLTHLLISKTGKVHEELREIVIERIEKTTKEISYEFNEDDEEDYDPIVFVELREKMLSADILEQRDLT